MRRFPWLSMILTCLWVGGAGSSFAQWTADADFGSQGQVRFAADSLTLPVQSELLPDGKVLVLCNAGPVSPNLVDRDVLVYRLLADGRPDSTFGVGGECRFDFAGLDHSTGADLLLEADGSLLVLGSGYTWDSSESVLGVVARVSAQGQVVPVSPDSFQVRLAGLGHQEYPNALDALPGGGFAVAGNSLDPNGWHQQPVLFQYQSDWQLDSSFAGTGKLLFDLDGGISLRAVHFSGGTLRDQVVLPDGRRVICGSISNGVHLEGLLACIRTDGSLDPAFNPPLGYLTLDLFGDEDTRLNRVALLPDSTLVFAGSAGFGVPERDILLGRTNPVNGSWVSETIATTGATELRDMQVVPGTMEILVCGSSIVSGQSHPVWAHIPSAAQLEIHELVEPGLVDGKGQTADVIVGKAPNRVLVWGMEEESISRKVLLGNQWERAGVQRPEPQQLANGWAIWPQPASKILFLQGPEAREALTLLDMNGQVRLQAQSLPGQLTELDLSGLPSGVYLLQAGAQFLQKIVVLR